MDVSARRTGCHSCSSKCQEQPIGDGQHHMLTSTKNGQHSWSFPIHLPNISQHLSTSIHHHQQNWLAYIHAQAARAHMPQAAWNTYMPACSSGNSQGSQSRVLVMCYDSSTGGPNYSSLDQVRSRAETLTESLSLRVSVREGILLSVAVANL